MKKRVKIICSILGTLALSTIGVLPVVISSCTTNDSNGTNNNQTQNENPQPEPIIPPKPEPEDITPLDSTGGDLNGLSVDSYLVLAKHLNLNKQTKLSSLSNQSLTSNLRDVPEFNQLSITIQDNSSELEGKLILKCNGVYKSQPIDVVFTITNFDHTFTDFSFINPQLNYESWFDNKQPTIESNGLSLATNKDIIKTFISNETKLLFNNKTQLTWNELISNYEITNISLSKTNEKIVFKNISFDIPLSTYSNNKWNITDNKQISQKTNTPFESSLPNLKELQRTMANQLKMDDTKLSELQTYIPSYFVGKHRYASEYLQNGAADNIQITKYLNWNEIENKYKSTYFPTQEYNVIPVYENNQFLGNDELGSLNMNFAIIDTDTPNNIDVQKRIEVQKMKSIDSIINNKENIVVLQPDLSTNTFANKIKQQVLDAAKQALSSNQPQTQTIQRSTLLQQNIKLFNWIAKQSDSQNPNIQYLKQIQNYFSTISLFGNYIETTNIGFYEAQQSLFPNFPFIDLSNGLLNWINNNPTNIVTIDWITYNFPEQIEFNIIPNPNNTVNIEFNGTMEISFTCLKNKEPQQFNNTFKLLLTSKDLN